MPIAPTEAQITQFSGAANGSDEPVVMLNLLRFKERADGINAEEGISGAEAYGRYGAGVAEHLARVGGRILHASVAQQTVIGPDEREWDMVILAEYPSRAAFLEMAGDPDYLQVHQHRESALADSRLIACTQVQV